MAIKSKLVKFLRKLKYNSFHVVIYTIAPEVLVENPRKFNYLLNECEPQSKLWQNILRLSPSKIYEVKDDKILVHSSSYFESSLLLNQLGFKGFSAIGNCYTNPIYRGLGIYGWTIREICIQNCDNHST